MKKLVIILLVAVCVSGCGTLKSFYSGPEFENWGSLELPIAVDKNDIEYLGLSAEAASFALKEIEADYIIVQIFNMYCIYCQNEAPKVNKMYELTKKKKEYAGIKILGIGAGNTPLEISEFKREFETKFPLFPDPDGKISRQTHYRFTPSFFGIKKNAAGDLKEVIRNPGGIEDEVKFLDVLIGKNAKE